MKIGTPVEFKLPDKVVHGHLYKKGTLRNRAQVIDNSNVIWRVPEGLLKVRKGSRRNTIVTKLDLERSKYRVGDLVTFHSRGTVHSGIICKLNPTKAVVQLNSGDQWTVPYNLLQLVLSQNPSRASSGRVQKISDKARSLMDSHGLKEWNLRFDESIRSLGKCNYRDRIISLSRSHVLDGKEEDIIDTILHEIAHAIAGPKARHGPEWKKVAIQIGATPRSYFKHEE